MVGTPILGPLRGHFRKRRCLVFARRRHFSSWYLRFNRTSGICVLLFGVLAATASLFARPSRAVPFYCSDRLGGIFMAFRQAQDKRGHSAFSEREAYLQGLAPDICVAVLCDGCR